MDRNWIFNCWNHPNHWIRLIGIKYSVVGMIGLGGSELKLPYSEWSGEAGQNWIFNSRKTLEWSDGQQLEWLDYLYWIKQIRIEYLIIGRNEFNHSCGHISLLSTSRSQPRVTFLLECYIMQGFNPFWKAQTLGTGAPCMGAQYISTVCLKW